MKEAVNEDIVDFLDPSVSKKVMGKNAAFRVQNVSTTKEALVFLWIGIFLPRSQTRMPPLPFSNKTSQGRREADSET